MRRREYSIDDHAWDVLQAWMTRQGVTDGALLEALAELIEANGGAPSRLIGRAPGWIRRAQEITVERRRRPR